MLATLAIYCLLIAAASLFGGWIPNLIRMDHRHTQMILSLVSGVMLGVAFLHLLPHSMDLLDNEYHTMLGALGGLLFMFFMIRMFHFHHHDAADQDHHECDHGHHEHEIKMSDVSWVGLAIGFAVHSLIDGIALGAAVGANAGSQDYSSMAGMAVFLAVLLHKPLDALTITSLMAARNWNRKQRAVVNVVFSLMCPLGAVLFVTGAGMAGDGQQMIFGLSLAFSAGVFLCISLGDLLPEVQFHSHDRLAMSGMLLLGVAIAAGLEWLPF